MERHTKDLSLLRLTVQLPGQMLYAKPTWRCGPITPSAASVSLPRPVCRSNQVAAVWAAFSWPRPSVGHASTSPPTRQVEDFALGMKGSLDDENRQRRDKLLESLGFSVEYEDALHMKGRIHAPAWSPT